MNNGSKKGTRTYQVLIGMNIAAWLAFVGFMIEASGILVSFCVSCIKPEAAKNMYNGLNLLPIRQFSFVNYTIAAALLFASLAMKALVSYIAIRLLGKVNMNNPFTRAVSRRLERMSYILLLVFFTGLLGNIHAGWLQQAAGIHIADQDAGQLLFIAGLVFLISQVFKRGVELQSENELTV